MYQLSLVGKNEIKDKLKPQNNHPDTRKEFLRLITLEIDINSRYGKEIKSPMQIAMINEFGDIIQNYNPYKKYGIDEDMLKVMYEIKFRRAQNHNRKCCETCEYSLLFDNTLQCTFYRRIWFETHPKFCCKECKFDIEKLKDYTSIKYSKLLKRKERILCC